MNKDDYILRSLAKVRHKKWELYVISRILHRLDDPDIEFICQQLIRRPDGKRALTDLYFPQFNLHLEVDEPQHATKGHVNADKQRTRDIIDATGHVIKRIRVYKETSDTLCFRPLSEISEEIDSCIESLKKRKIKLIEEEAFQAWDFELRFSSIPHIQQGFIDLENGAVFRTQLDVLKCFGFRGKGYQRGAWNLPYDEKTMVWFPKLFEGGEWNNELSVDGELIYERKKQGHEETWEKSGKRMRHQRICFAHATDELGKRLYRYKGLFKYDEKKSNRNETAYVKISDRIDLPVANNDMDKK